MQKRLVIIFKYSFFLAAGILLVWWSLHKMSDRDYGEFKHSLATADYSLLIPVFFILTTSHISRAIRWILPILHSRVWERF
jgi:glycosyltransferase 2 family protein